MFDSMSIDHRFASIEADARRLVSQKSLNLSQGSGLSARSQLISMGMTTRCCVPFGYSLLLARASVAGSSRKTALKLQADTYSRAAASK